MNERVIYVLRSGGQVLCELRDLNGTMQNCILGGSVEPCDRGQIDYILASVRREAKEELGIRATQCKKADDFVSKGITFHVVIVEQWDGSIPRVNRDNNNELRWVPLEELIGGISLEPLKEIIEKLGTT